MIGSQGPQMLSSDHLYWQVKRRNLITGWILPPPNICLPFRGLPSLSVLYCVLERLSNALSLELEFCKLWVCEPCVCWLLLDLKTNKNNNTISYALNSLSECHPAWKVVLYCTFFSDKIFVFISAGHVPSVTQCHPVFSPAPLLCAPDCTDRSNGIWDLLNCCSYIYDDSSPHQPI